MKEIALTPEYLRKLGEGMRDQIMATISPKERLAGLSPETILSHVPPEAVVSHFSPEELLAELDPEVIEAYLQKRKQREAAKAPRKQTTPRRKSSKSSSAT